MNTIENNLGKHEIKISWISIRFSPKKTNTQPVLTKLNKAVLC